LRKRILNHFPMKKISSFFLLLFPCLLPAQIKHVVVEGRVTDMLYAPAAFATIQNTTTKEGTYADYTGYFSFKTILPATLKVSLVGYKTIVKNVMPKPGRDTIRVDFTLSIDSNQLLPVEVSSINKPELVKESGSLIDFETNQQKLWLLYNYRDGDHLEVYDDGTNYLTRIVLKHHLESINTTPHGFLYIKNQDSVHFFEYSQKSNSILISSIVVDIFDKFIHHLITFNDPCYYYLWIAPDSSAINYWYFNNQTKKRKILYYYFNPVLSVVNDSISAKLFLLNLLIYPINQEGLSLEQSSLAPSAVSETAESGNSNVAMAPQQGHGAGGERPNNSRQYEDEEKNYSALLHGIYSSLKIIRDSIYIFNFDNDSVYVYTIGNNLIRKMPLSFYVYGVKYRSRDIIVNEESTECYFKFILHGNCYLQKIDLNTGTKINTQKLAFPFPEKIRILGGYAYFTYLENDINQMFVRHLYRQKLN